MRNYLYIISILISFIYFYFNSDFNLNKENLYFPLTLVFFSLLFFVTKKDEIFLLSKNSFKHSNIFILGFIIVSFQVTIDFILGNVTSYNQFLFVNNSIVVKSTWLSVAALNSFFLGYSVKNNIKRFNFNSKIKSQKQNSIFILLSFIATIILYFSTVNPLYLAGYYGSENMGETATYAALMIKLFGYSYLIFKTRSLYFSNNINSLKDYILKMGYIFNLFLLIYLLSVMFSGDRGPLMTFPLAYLSGYFILTKKKLSYTKGFILVLAGAFFITTLGVVRSMNKDLSLIDRFSTSLEEDSYKKNSISPHTFELASSIKTIHHAVDYVPEKHDFLYGRFQFQQLFFTIPFASNFRELIYDDISYKYKGSASFITWVFQGDNPTYGNGTSAITDFYLDFGFFGVVFGLFFFGSAIRLAEQVMYNTIIPPLFLHVFVVCYMASALYIARSSVLFEFRNVVWIFLILKVDEVLFKLKQSV